MPDEIISFPVNDSLLTATNLFTGEQEYTFVISRGRFTSLGDNMISLKPIFSTAQSPTCLWGLSNVPVTLTPIIELAIGKKTQYGMATLKVLSDL